MAHDSTTQLQGWLVRMNAGDVAARDELISRAAGRLRKLTAKMLQDFRRVRSWEDTDDVLQSALVRLLRALQAVPVSSVQEFFRLAATQIRRELLDLTRHYFGPLGQGRNEAPLPAGEGGQSTSAPAYEPPASSQDLHRLQLWTEFHQQIEKMPAGERCVFDLVWYHGLTQAETASILNLSEAKVKRLWVAARLRLKDALHNQMPD